MAAPTENEVQKTLQEATDLWEQTRLFGDQNPKNWSELQDDVINSLVGGNAAAISNAVEAARGLLNNLLAPGTALAVWDNILLDYALAIGSPERDPTAILLRIYDHFIATSQTVNSRQIGYGAPVAAGGNVGDGQLLRLVRDAEGFDIESISLSTKQARCVADQHSGAFLHEEIFELGQTGAARDFVNDQGRGGIVEIRAYSAPQSIIANPTFTQFVGQAPSTGSPTTPSTINGWEPATSGDYSDLQMDVDVYRTSRGDGGNAVSVRMTDVETLTQKFTVANINASIRNPYFVQVAVKREALADGTLTLRVGTTTEVVAVNTLVDGSWNLVRLFFDEDLWYDNFNEADLAIEIDWAGRTTGTILLDDVLVVPWTKFDNSFYALVGGQTPFRRNDEFTFTDSLSAAEATIQYWLNRLYGIYLPHSPTPTLPDPV